MLVPERSKNGAECGLWAVQQVCLDLSNLMAKFLKELAAEGLSGAGEASVARGFSRTSGIGRSKQEGQHLGAGFSMTSSYKRTWPFVVLNLDEHRIHQVAGGVN